MTVLVRWEHRDGFDHLVLDSPATRNALSLRLLDELVAAVTRSADGPSRGLVLRHRGPAFCAGIDLREPRADDAHSRAFADLLARLWAYPKPLASIVNGAVRGAGMGILACSDIVAADQTSTFSYAEVRVGVAPALVLAVTLPVLPARALLPWLLTGSVFDGPTGLQLGVVTTLAPDGAQADPAAVTAALQPGAPGAQAVVKRLVRQSVDVTAAIERAAAESAALFAGAEAAEGMAAFTGRRRPSWDVVPGMDGGQP